MLAQAEAAELWQFIIKLASANDWPFSAVGSHLESWWLMYGFLLGASFLLQGWGVHDHRSWGPVMEMTGGEQGRWQFLWVHRHPRRDI